MVFPVRQTEPRWQQISRLLLLKLIAATVALMLVWGVAGLFLYVDPQADSPRHADVLFVLAPVEQSMDYAERLMQRGYAPTLALSVPLGKSHASYPAICNARRPYRIVCFNPAPITTQGEARALRTLSDTHEWKSADVLTAQFHLVRARVIVQRCYKGDLHMIADRRQLPLIALENATDSWVHEYLYQTAAFVKVALNPDC